MTSNTQSKTSTLLHRVFGAAASNDQGEKPQTKARNDARPLYVTLRVTPEEKERLQRDAGRQSVSAYVRSRLLGDDAKPRRTKGNYPVKDHEALAKVLRALGHSNLAQEFDMLKWASEDGAILIDRETAGAIRNACADIKKMRDDLVAALGLRPKRR